MPLSVAEMALLSRLLDEALPLDRAGRERWLESLAPEHAALAGNLRESLLDTSDVATGNGQFATLPKISQHEDLATFKVGDQIGPYQLLRQIGSGGMGSVWLAERSDGSLKRQVALKLPRLAWAPGLAERMRRERDILTALDHPHIARLYDAGVDTQGRPYLALEYVDGEPIDVYIGRNDLTVRIRLELFLQIAQAVTHAHARLVVHRDLKPSNILVNAEGQVRLLDFGIAKLLQIDSNADATAATQLTELAGAALTPDYASPEQIKGEPITVASDIYSLGVVLYEMLSGSRPFQFKGKTAGAMVEAMAETEAPFASRQTTQKNTQRTLRGDLDTILGKALKKNPAQRYVTVEAFASDVRRYLDGLPVLARPDGALYRLHKFVSRNRLAVGGAALALVAIVGGAIAAVWEARAATLEARRAEAEAQRSNQVKAFVAGLFQVASRSDAGNLDLGQTPAQVLLERGVRQIDTSFAGQPELQAELTGVIGTALADLGSADLAAEQAQRQLKLLERAGAPIAKQVDALELLARAQTQQSRLPEAESVLRKALEAATLLKSSRHTNIQLALVHCLIDQNRFAEAAKELDSGAAAWNEAGGTNATQQSEISLARAELLSHDNRWEEAKAQYEDAVKLADRAQGHDSELAIHTRVIYGRKAAIFGKPEAFENLNLAIEALRRRNGALDVQAALLELEMAVYIPMTRDQSMDRISHGRSIFERLGNRASAGAVALANLRIGTIYDSLGDVAKAKSLIESAASMHDGKPETGDERYSRLFALAGVLCDAGEHRKADAIYRTLNEYFLREFPNLMAFIVDPMAMNLLMEDDIQAVDDLLLRSSSLVRERPEVFEPMRARVELARGQFRQAAERIKPFLENPAVPAAKFLAGRALCDSGDFDRGGRLLTQDVTETEASDVASSPRLAMRRAVLGLCLLKAGDVRNAKDLAAMAQRAFSDQPAVSQYFKKPLYELQRELKSSRTPT